MSWEFTRDIGLVVFVTGGILASFRLSKILHRYLGSPNVALVATIGDAMMLAGTSLALTAMIIGYLMPSEIPLNE